MSEVLGGSFEGASKPIPFEEFTRERTNNFYLYFIPEFMGDDYREEHHYKEFEKENPDLAQKLLGAYAYQKEDPAIPIGPNSSEEDKAEFRRKAARNQQTFQDHRQDLYNAYLTMRKYVKNDEELFS